MSRYEQSTAVHIDAPQITNDIRREIRQIKLPRAILHPHLLKLLQQPLTSLHPTPRHRMTSIPSRIGRLIFSAELTNIRFELFDGEFREDVGDGGGEAKLGELVDDALSCGIGDGGMGRFGEGSRVGERERERGDMD